MTKLKSVMTVFVAALFLTAVTAVTSMAGTTMGTDTSMGAQTGGETSTMSMSHDGINSGRDFGQHVKDHNDMFSGDHNPGVNHNGYSGIKN